MQSTLPFTAHQDAPFRSLITFGIDGVNKTILFIGKVNGMDQRGHCLAILNYNNYLVEQASYKLIESKLFFRETVPKHFDLSIITYLLFKIKTGLCCGDLV